MREVFRVTLVGPGGRPWFFFKPSSGLKRAFFNIIAHCASSAVSAGRRGCASIPPADCTSHAHERRALSLTLSTTSSAPLAAQTTLDQASNAEHAGNWKKRSPPQSHPSCPMSASFALLGDLAFEAEEEQNERGQARGSLGVPRPAPVSPE